MKIVNNNNILYIFDTWGTSSYYHILIDHIIPLWITKNIIEEHLNTQIDKSFFLRISNHQWENNIEHIFKYFMNDTFTDNIINEYKYIIYGYCYNYRPYNPKYITKYIPKYKYWLDKFIKKFRKSPSEEKYILIPKRVTRIYENMDKIYEELSKLYKIKMLDFSDYTIEEQINLCSSCWAMIGCEGAAFANQIFMQNNSLIIILDKEKGEFQIPLSTYMEHECHLINYSNITYENIIDTIIDICKKFTS